MTINALTTAVRTVFNDLADELNGKVLTRPALLVTDGLVQTYAVDVDIGQTEPLRNVPLARGNREVSYADVGNACRLRRTASGRYEVVGFSKETPGTYTRVTVNLDTLTLTSVTDLSIRTALVEYGDLAYGTTPYGASAISKGGTVERIV